MSSKGNGDEGGGGKHEVTKAPNPSEPVHIHFLGGDSMALSAPWSMGNWRKEILYKSE